ncbi:mannose-6-phosphate isomerase [Diaminobutyricibacter tongyongensis]|uniref:Mannose-6-phosphate isomerase n=2 Tax=Leifsonia tongyongensis TaxID=1268043 RepID=A0A6L9Y3X7_9MICO|nr:class I mannose-6-phosphate isomerase [Diaminobutyricibacter tongyongensis]NEN07908.1 mannose-6-phosphate isomerase [Diaminobutyricibacter tongyongensis]
MHTTYDKQPSVELPPGSVVWSGAEAWSELDAAARAATTGRPAVIAIDTYPGVDLPALIAELRANLPGYDVIDVEEAAARPIEEIDALIGRNLTDDRVFGVMGHFTLDEFYDADRLAALAASVADTARPVILVGWGAALTPVTPDVLVLADLARWEIQLRQRRGATNWRTDNAGEDNLRKYKRGFFVEWRVADLHKRDLFDRIDFLLDTNTSIRNAGLITGDAFRTALANAAAAPLRVVPFFDPGVWGGQWMKDRLDLDRSAANYAWCFDCVPEENSLLLEADGRVVEIPAMDLVLSQPRELLGAKTFARFGAEFPIRFDFLDTMGGGNLSLQVHPLTDYIQTTFGMHYTQDESYYLLDADDDAVVYLGLKTGIDPDEVVAALQAATDGAHPFDAEKYVNRIPARKHDHFSIPAGTVHASGANSMVLEISATPFIFTFKLWDWGRVGIDGIPRPIHLDHGIRNIQWDRDTTWVESNLLGHVEVISEREGVREERTGLHELEFIEVRRHWFTDEVHHDSEGTVNVLNLVEGDEVEIASPTGAFAPYRIHYAETFIVPAAVGPYIIRRTAQSKSEQFATVKAYVRGTRDVDD